MARSRNIKPGFFTNEDLTDLPPEFRLLFIGLWTLADREGYLEDRPKRIKRELFPDDKWSVEEGLKAIAASGQIVRYAVGGERFIQITNFLKHQNPHFREKQSVIPKPQAFTPSLSTESLRLLPDGSSSSTNLALGSTPMDGGGSPADSLIPDSLIPEVTTTSKVNGHRYNDDARGILAFLNEKTGRAYKPGEANLRLIVARLKEGATVMQCRQVIVRKAREWQGDAKMDVFLRPATLFNQTKFAQYQGELVVPQEAQDGG